MNLTYSLILTHLLRYCRLAGIRVTLWLRGIHTEVLLSGDISTDKNFRNYQNVDVTACKVEDADGDLATTDDQTPISEWTVYLSIDGIRQTPGQLT